MKGAVTGANHALLSPDLPTSCHHRALTPAPSEVALEPGASLQWVFVPQRVGTYELLCTVPGHEAMVGTLRITSGRAVSNVL